MEKTKINNCLESVAPELLEEWNYEKNNSLNPKEVTCGSKKKVWWKCKKCGNEWEATPSNRIKGTGCPKCGLLKIGTNKTKTLIKKNGSLFTNRPDLAKEWNYDKNNPLTPADVTCGSKKKVWWKCELGHEWEASICNRSNGSGCLYCTGQKAIVGKNDLKTTNPELLEEWDYIKNGELLPENCKAKSNLKVWWKCELGHSWKTSIAHRTNGNKCPHCFSEYGTSFPEQAIYYYLSKITKVENRKKIENQEIDIYLPDLNIGFEYDGIYYHSTIKSRKKEKTKDEILKSNNVILYRIKESSDNRFDKENNIIYCKIDRDYKYIEEVLKIIEKIIKIELPNLDIIRDNTKIYKQYIKSIKQQNFTVKNPELLEEWDYIQNEGLLPENFTSGSNKKVWWKCKKCNSSYLTTISHKIEGNNCPYCNGKKVNETNNLKTKYPELLKIWDYEKNNELLPENIYFSSRKKVWWKCDDCGKSFQSQICVRIRAKTNFCPECMHKHIGNKNRENNVKNKGNLVDINSPLLEEWNYEKNTSIKPTNVSSKSGISVWWKCKKCGNEWEAKIYNRTYGTGCPKCHINNKN